MGWSIKLLTILEYTVFLSRRGGIDCLLTLRSIKYCIMDTLHLFVFVNVIVFLFGIFVFDFCGKFLTFLWKNCEDFVQKLSLDFGTNFIFEKADCLHLFLLYFTNPSQKSRKLKPFHFFSKIDPSNPPPCEALRNLVLLWQSN